MDDISEHVHEKNDEHTAIHGPRRALERLRAMTWRVETLPYLIHIFPKSLSALDLIFADFPHRIKKIEIGVLRGVESEGLGAQHQSPHTEKITVVTRVECGVL